MKRDSQCVDIMRYLEAHPEGLTIFEAFLILRCSKLSTRIGEIVRGGYMEIVKTPELKKYPDGSFRRIMRYRKAA